MIVFKFNNINKQRKFREGKVKNLFDFENDINIIIKNWSFFLDETSPKNKKMVDIINNLNIDF